MKFSASTFFAAATSLALAGGQPTNPSQSTSGSTACAPVHIIVVRASTEAPGQGIIGTLATKISAANPGTSVEAIDYPALLDPYAQSSANGTAQTTKQLISYVEKCSNAKIVMLGYSQGAHVIGDTICGGGNAPGLLAYTPPVDKKYSDKVVAMIQMGDPRHVPNKSFDVGTSTNAGVFPRPSNISCDPFASIIQSYCDATDEFCDSGNSISVHQSYTFRYNDAALAFVMSKLK